MPHGVPRSFRKILIAVDGSPLAAHAADGGLELARSLGGEVALIHAIDPSLRFALESGVPAAAPLQRAEQDGKQLLAEFRPRATLQAPPLEFLPIGKPATAIVKAAKEWPTSS